MGLAALLGVKQAERFLQSAWPNAPFVVHGPLQRLSGLISPKVAGDLSALFALPAQKTFAQLRDGERFSNAEVTVEAALALHRSGVSIYQWEVALQSRGAQKWLGALRRDLGLPDGLPRIGLFASRKGVGAPIHFDGQESLVVQLAGKKEWTIAANENIAFPGTNHVAADAVPAELKSKWKGRAPSKVARNSKRVVLAPGSVMFLPRGFWHSTRTIQDSAHFDLMLPLPTWKDVLVAQLGEQLEADPRWRAPAVDAAQSLAMAQALAEEARRYVARFHGASGSRPASRKASGK
jgi:50S ribosomal protein L16 3-hydroxylase